MFFSVPIFSILFLVQLAKPELTEEAEKWVKKELRQQDCGTILPHLEFKKRIFGTFGHKIPVMSRPWMALLYLPDNMDHCRCGGSLITKRFVLTAAHCLEMCDRSKDLKVRLGEHSIKASVDCSVFRGQKICAPPVENFDVEKIILHEEFNLYKQINDIALLQLNQTVIPNIHIRPICLPLTDDLQAKASILGHSFFVTGWGYTELKQMSDTLLEVPVRSYQCPRRFINRSVLCSSGHIQDTCKGDSGGPLIANGFFFGSTRQVQFGLVSHGSPTCGQGKGAYFTKVPSFIPWIIKKIAIYCKENSSEPLLLNGNVLD